MAKCFKVGDRVKAIVPVDGNTKIINEVGTVIEAKNPLYIRYGIEFDNDVAGHSCNCKGKYGRCWWCYESDLELVEPEKIVITTNGEITTAKLYHGKTVSKTATAKRHPDDVFNFVEGAKIAFDRLTDRETHKPETNIIKVGDCVKVINTGAACITAINYVTNLTTNPRLLARYAYGNDLGYNKGVRTLDETFEVIATDGIKAYITENIADDYCPCYIFDVTGLKKITKWRF